MDLIEHLRKFNVAEPLCQQVEAEIARLQAALETYESWVDRCTKHVGHCEGGDKCTCGRTAVLYEARALLDEQIAK